MSALASAWIGAHAGLLVIVVVRLVLARFGINS